MIENAVYIHKAEPSYKTVHQNMVLHVTGQWPEYPTKDIS